jgi:mannose-6-phosphate isomerase-like protein (cupin superfamily)
MNIETKELARRDNLLIVELTIPREGFTRLHKHQRTEEHYQVLSGTGKMHIEEDGRMVEKTLLTGQFFTIPPNCPHKIWHAGQEMFPLVILSIKDSSETDYEDLEGNVD